MKKNIVISYPAPQVINIQPTISSNGNHYTKVNVLLKWGNDLANVKITKVNGGYKYEDIGIFSRVFASVEALCWEFELPEKVKRELKLLK